MSATDELDDALALALAVAADAAASLRGVRPSEIRTKGDPRDLVTEWDTRTEARIRAALAAATPAIPMLGEEGGLGGADAGDGRRWVVDPIDGTTNFAHGLPWWAVSIALERGDVLEVGVVAAPALGWTFAARQGGGARFTGPDGDRRLEVSAVAALGQALLVTGFPAERAAGPDENFTAWEHLQRRSGGCRRLGAASLDLCAVAAGMVDGYWEWALQPWDIAAGALIVAEAGGRVTDTQGGPFRSRSGEVVASNGVIHDALVAELAVVTGRRAGDRRSR